MRSPDCRQGKHGSCVGEAWNDDTEQTVPCGCPCHHPSGGDDAA